ncbi:hypothetical protein M9H77_26358 [Catharanthus roseus]|uniref:Uncharacterized protein n=1 Tax=Catharanthus roseus TaxID=4058 RepID=A0ACC0A9J7_CATRO|nr:hypothetical protein M9H77_26358 [Catharanthus roseus]
MLCKYPLISSLIFGAFAVSYLLAFLISSWKVVAFVINKNIRARINTLASTVMIALPLQVLCLALSALWTPDDPAYGCAVLAMFLCVVWFVVVGEVILVITPITEALAAGGHYCPWSPSMSLRRSEVESS